MAKQSKKNLLINSLKKGKERLDQALPAPEVVEETAVSIEKRVEEPPLVEEPKPALSTARQRTKPAAKAQRSAVAKPKKPAPTVEKSEEQLSPLSILLPEDLQDEIKMYLLKTKEFRFMKDYFSHLVRLDLGMIRGKKRPTAKRTKVLDPTTRTTQTTLYFSEEVKLAMNIKVLQQRKQLKSMKHYIIELAKKDLGIE